MAKINQFDVIYDGQDTSEFLEAIGHEIRERYGEDCYVRLHIEVYEYPGD